MGDTVDIYCNSAKRSESFADNDAEDTGDNSAERSAEDIYGVFTGTRQRRLFTCASRPRPCTRVLYFNHRDEGER